jgi:hypothetical protein
MTIRFPVDCYGAALHDSSGRVHRHDIVAFDDQINCIFVNGRLWHWRFSGRFRLGTGGNKRKQKEAKKELKVPGCGAFICHYDSLGRRL